METPDWIREFPGSIIVCDLQGTILQLNEIAVENFKDQGGAALIGCNLLECHPETARRKLVQMLAEQKANIYTIEKNGVKELIYQTPWYQNGQCGGYVELSLFLPNEMPHFVRS